MEAFQSFFSEFCNAVLGFLVSLLPFRMCLAVEFVSVADKFLLKGFGEKVLMRQWQFLSDNLFLRKTGSGMPFADACVAWIALGAHNLSTYYAVADIRLGAEAFYSGSIASEYANIMEHCCLDDELSVKVQFGMRVANLHGSFHDQRAVGDENPPELVVLRVVFVYY